MTNPVKLPTAAKLEMPPNTDSLVPHALANFLPMIDAKPFDDLKENIKKNGLLEPIMLFEGQILDGRNRYKACKDIGYAFTAANFKTFEGDHAAAEEWVISTQFLRRQMSSKQKNEVIQKMIEKYPTEGNREIARRCGLNSHSQVGIVREKMREPFEAEEKSYKQFCKIWDDLPSDRRSQFVKTNAAGLRVLLAQ